MSESSKEETCHSQGDADECVSGFTVYQYDPGSDLLIISNDFLSVERPREPYGITIMHAFYIYLKLEAHHSTLGSVHFISPTRLNYIYIL